MPGGGLAMVHQRALDSEVVIRESGGDSYGGGGTQPGCDPTIVHTTVTLFDKAHLSASPTDGTPAIPNTLLPVDLAAHADAEGNVELSLVAAADNRVVTITPRALEAATGPNTNCDDGDDSQPVNGEPVALAYWERQDRRPDARPDRHHHPRHQDAARSCCPARRHQGHRPRHVPPGTTAAR